jgi:arsenical pump membrane protein
MSGATTATWSIAGLAAIGVVVRPWNLPEYVWAVVGAALLVALDLLPWREAVAAAAKGLDVYYFLVGMMLLAEVARREGLFDWLATAAVRHSDKSASRLFLIVYSVGTIVTVFLSNDATAVVLTPAVYAATRAAGVEPLPYLLVCAFIANAASFVLPISNPANLVVFGAGMPSLIEWLRYFGLPSVISIAVTYTLLRFSQRASIGGQVAEAPSASKLSNSGKVVAAGIAVTAIVLLGVSSRGLGLGLPTLVCGATVTVITLALRRQTPRPVLADISWSVIPLVGGLFILVQGLNHTGMLSWLTETLRDASSVSPRATSWLAGTIVAFVSNLINNLPMGLIAATTTQAAEVPNQVTAAVLIGVDLGPNLSVTGSLATILWLNRRPSLPARWPSRHAASALARSARTFTDLTMNNMRGRNVPPAWLGSPAPGNPFVLYTDCPPAITATQRTHLDRQATRPNLDDLPPEGQQAASAGRRPRNLAEFWRVLE